MYNDKILQSKITEVIEELKSSKLLKEKAPSWVNSCPSEINSMKYEFTDWLQFIFLPNCIQQHSKNVLCNNRNDLALQAKNFLGNDPTKEKLFQLLIELDALM